MIKLADKNVKTAIINTFHMFKKAEKHMSVRNEMEGIKRPTWKYRDQKHNI